VKIVREKNIRDISLLLSLGTTLGWGGSGSTSTGGGTWLVLLGDWHSLSVLGQLVEHVSALATGVSVGVISHVGT
jgi:hypothetical protein